MRHCVLLDEVTDSVYYTLDGHAIVPFRIEDVFQFHWLEPSFGNLREVICLSEELLSIVGVKKITRAG